MSLLRAPAEKLWTDTLRDASEKATSAIDAGIDAVSGVVRKTRKTVVEEADKAYAQAQVRAAAAAAAFLGCFVCCRSPA